MRTRKRNGKWRILALVLSVALCIGSLPVSGTTTEAASTITTNGNGGKTDVGAWFTTYNTTDFWGSQNRFADPNNAPIGFKALRADGTYGIPTSSSVEEIDFQIKKMAEAGIDFILFDLTNGGLSSAFTYGTDASLAFVVANAKLTCERLAAWNDTHEWKIRYAIGVGVYYNLRASYTSGVASVGQAAELQAQAVQEQFVNNSVYGDDYYKVDGKPLLVLHDTSADNALTAWNAYSGSKTYGGQFTVRSSNSQAQAGSYGWYTRGATTEGNNCGSIADDEVMLVCPGQLNHANGNTTPAAARENGQHYVQNWAAVLHEKPRIVMISSLNDYMEDTQIWPTNTDNVANGEEEWVEPYQYWKITVNRIAQLREENGDTVLSAAQRSGNLLLNAEVATNKQVEPYAVSRLTDGVTDYINDTNTNGIAGYTDGISYFEMTLEESASVNQVKLLTTPHEKTSFPQDIAIDVKCSNGLWVRAAEVHDISHARSLVFNFETIDDATKIRVSANQARNDSGNFRLCEIEAYCDTSLTAGDYTGTTKDETESFNIPEIASDNLVRGKTAATQSGYTANNLAKLTNGVNGYLADKTNSDYGYVLYGAGATQNNETYFEFSFDAVTPLNKVRLYRTNQQAAGTLEDMEPRDIVVDVKLQDGTWKRVSANYNINYNSYDVITNSVDGVVQDSSILFTFETVECVGFRVTSDRQRIRVANNALSATYNWKLSEIEAYYDPNVTEFSEIEAPDNADYAITMLTLTNYALNKTATTNADANQFDGTKVTDGSKSTSPLLYFRTTGSGSTNMDTAYVEIDLGEVRTFNRVDLSLFLEYTTNANYAAYGAAIRDPRDVAIDVLDTDERWVRVAEAHNLEYGTLTANKTVTNNYYFDLISGSKVRITFNKYQVTNVAHGSASNPLVSPAEVAVYCDYNVMSSQLTGIQPATVSKTEIPLYSSDNYALGGTVSSNGVENSNNPWTKLTDGVVGSGGNINRAISYYWQGGNANKTGNNIRYFDIAFSKEVLINQVVIDYVDNTDGINSREQDIALDVLTAEGTYVRVAEKHNMEDVANTQKYTLKLNFAEIKAVGIRITANNIQSKNYATASAPFLAYSEVAALYNPNVPTAEGYTGIGAVTVTGSEIPLYVSENYALGGTVTSTNTSEGLGRDYPVDVLTDGEQAKTSTCGIINYVDNLASIEVSFLQTRSINEVRLYLSQDEQTMLPHDLALSVKVNGKWQRAAELNEQMCTGSTNYLTFKFPAVKASAIRVTVTNATNTASVNFRLVEIGAYFNPATTRADYTCYTDLTGELVHDDADIEVIRQVLTGVKKEAIDVNGDGKGNSCDLVHLLKKN